MADIIAALSTAPKKSGIGVIRISGDRAVECIKTIFRPYGTQRWHPRVMTAGSLHNADGRMIDSVLAVWFRGPKSYTGEDLAELHCHGSLAVLNAALSALYSAGARPAKAGEFTKRAFLNGKLDLSQAEAVGDLIDSETEDAAVNAAAQLGGALSKELNAVYDALVDLLAHFQAVVDYPDEDIEEFGLERAQTLLAAARERLEALTSGYERGKILKEGVDCAIIGKPNVGKSSLLNALVGYDRAIVTPVAGTTRDVVEAYARVGGVMLKLHDTAGIRETGDAIETIGIDRAVQTAKVASLVLAVVDGSKSFDEMDRRVIANTAGKKAILLVNKCDLPQVEVPAPYTEGFAYVIPVSAMSGAGLDLLEAAVKDLYAAGDLRLDGTLITNARQEGACRTAAAFLQTAVDALRNGFPPDMILYDVEQGMERIGEILGRSTPEDVVERIFANFCVGK